MSHASATVWAGNGQILVDWEMSMMPSRWPRITLGLVALNMGATFAHVLEMPAKMELSAPDYLRVQRIYRGFGAAGAILEPGSILASALITARARGTTPAFERSLAGTSALASALAVWFGLVAPMNARFKAWTENGIPDDWVKTRDQWEYAHAARFALQLAGFVALLRATVGVGPEHHDTSSAEVPGNTLASLDAAPSDPSRISA